MIYKQIKKLLVSLLITIKMYKRQFIIKQEGDNIMESIGNILSMLDYVLDTTRKRHIAGGVLMSISLLFGGLALTVMTIKEEQEEGFHEQI